MQFRTTGVLNYRRLQSVCLIMVADLFYLIYQDQFVEQAVLLQIKQVDVANMI